jgi:short-subunit dehydrogenase
MGKRILITGCSSGLGRAMAAELARRGHAVVATARRRATIADLDVAQHLALDVMSDQSVADAVGAAGAVDILINNAGVTVWGAVESPSATDVQRIFDTNVFGALRVLRGFLPAMRARKAGAIYQISSAAARRSTALLGHYAATKAALEAYSEALRIELSPFGIDVCIVSLGAIETKFGDNRQEVISPDYADLAARVKGRIAASRKVPWSAESVAVRIADAIEAGKPPLRLDGTSDAFALIAQRTTLADDEWERRTLADLWRSQAA